VIVHFVEIDGPDDHYCLILYFHNTCNLHGSLTIQLSSRTIPSWTDIGVLIIYPSFIDGQKKKLSVLG
jgi:hypothetical protein